MLVRRFNRYEGDIGKPREVGGRELERARGDVNQMDAGSVVALLERIQQQRQLLPASAAKLDDRPGVTELGGNLPRMRRQQRGFGAGDRVPGQAADRLEQ